MKTYKIIIAIILLAIAIPAMAQTTAEDYYNIGKSFYERGKYEKALENLKEAKKLNPEDSEIIKLYGQALAKVEKVDDLDVADSKSLKYLEGLSALSNNNPTKALEDLKEAGEKGMDSPEYNKNMAIALANAPEDSEASMGFAGSDKKAEVKKFYRKAIEASNNDPKMIAAYGQYLASTEDVDISEDISGSASLAYLNGLSAMTNDNPELAAGYFETATSKAPSNNDYQLALASAYTETGDFDKAMVAYNKVSPGGQGFGFAAGDEMSPEFKQQLIESAKTNKIDEKGRTMLHIAVINGNYEAVKVLLENGINPEIEDNSGKTALDYCKSDEIKEILEQYTD